MAIIASSFVWIALMAVSTESFEAASLPGEKVMAVMVWVPRAVSSLVNSATCPEVGKLFFMNSAFGP